MIRRKISLLCVPSVTNSYIKVEPCPRQIPFQIWPYTVAVPRSHGEQWDFSGSILLVWQYSESGGPSRIGRWLWSNLPEYIVIFCQLHEPNLDFEVQMEATSRRKNGCVCGLTVFPQIAIRVGKARHLDGRKIGIGDSPFRFTAI